ncbi:uncharacterized protein KY384_002781 [Bacidia gigantensis]|uniref:uncharacterized protein n=1 Tax=Bacidia gigantensis TaxID=2732470 RepID=UPI001D0500CF|nr:uncharacterized protein KY384_002781 [Bacidia gigantensis]KAG8532903.1 hypothetical protein KY384_002781 [Bacidia gigantensis]
MKLRSLNQDIKADTTRLTQQMETLESTYQHEDFMTWLAPPDSSHIYEHARQKVQEGTAGSGKSVLRSFRARKILSEFHLDNSHGRYLRLERKSQGPTLSDLIKILTVVLDHVERLFVVLDALDEGENIDQLLETILKFRKIKRESVNLILTSREDRSIADAMLAMDAVNIDLYCPMVDSDISIYIEQTLEHDRRLKRWNQNLKADIQHALDCGAHGMFRWVDCQLEVLRKCMKPQAVQKTLRSLPKTLSETYDNILANLPEEYVEDTKKLLQFLAFSKRPLRLTELAETLAVDLAGEPMYDPGNRLLDVRDTLEICSGFVTVVNKAAAIEHQEVRLSHATVKEYLTSKPGHDPNEKCGVLGGALQAAVYKGHLRVVRTLIEHGSDPNSSGGKFRCPLITACVQGNCDMVSLLVGSGARISNATWSQGNALNCTADYGHESVIRLLLDLGADVNACVGKSRATALSTAAYQGHEAICRLLVARGANVDKRGGQNALRVAVESGYPNIVRFLLGKKSKLSEEVLESVKLHDWFKAMESASNDSESLSANIDKLFRSAVLQGSFDVVEQSLRSGVNVNSYNRIDYSPLALAADKGHESIIKLLLQNGADINAEGECWGTALHIAARRGHTSIVRLLLTQDPPAKVNAQGIVRGNIINCKGTVLQNGIRSAKPEIVESLIQAGADINAHIEGVGTPTIIASSLGDLDMVRLLLKNGADIKPDDPELGTALHAAVASGNPAVVQELLKNGIDPNALAGDSVTALETAASDGHSEIVSLLLQHGAEIEVHRKARHEGGKESKGALGAAAFNGWESVFIQILDAGALVDHTNVYIPLTALQYAAQAQQTKIISAAIARNIDIDAKDYLLLTTSGLSKNENQMANLEYLLSLGADPNYIDPNTLDFPLMVAARTRQTIVIDFLLSHGADVNLSNRDGWTALIDATKNHQNTSTRCLIEEHHADLKKTLINGSTAFHLAAQSNFYEGITLLLEHGEDINQTNDDGNTALHIAIDHDGLAAVKVLLEHNAAVNIPEKHSGMTAVDLAEFNNAPDSKKQGYLAAPIAEMLREHVAGPDEREMQVVDVDRSCL